MQVLRKHIIILIQFCLLVILTVDVYAFDDKPKGSRLYIKPAPKAKKLSFQSGKSVLPFKTPANSLELKTSKTTSLYFNSLLSSRNMPNENQAEMVKVVSNPKTVESTKIEKSKSGQTDEPIERFYNGDGLQVSNIYPNPVDDYGTFEYQFTNANKRTAKIEFYNVLGTPTNIVAQLDRFDKKVKVYLKNLPNGIYFYQLVADGKTLATKKLLIRHAN